MITLAIDEGDEKLYDYGISKLIHKCIKSAKETNEAVFMQINGIKMVVNLDDSHLDVYMRYIKIMMKKIDE